MYFFSPLPMKLNMPNVNWRNIAITLIRDGETPGGLISVAARARNLGPIWVQSLPNILQNHGL